jgi:hypothetical protein
MVMVALLDVMTEKHGFLRHPFSLRPQNKDSSSHSQGVVVNIDISNTAPSKTDSSGTLKTGGTKTMDLESDKSNHSKSSSKDNVSSSKELEETLSNKETVSSNETF